MSALPKITAPELAQFLAAVCSGSEMGELNIVATAEPWQKRPAPPPISSMDFPKTVRLTLKNQLYIEKSGCSQFALNAIKRLAAFANPDFYKAQAMRLPIYNKPRIIDCSEDMGTHLAIPRGCLEPLSDLLDRADAAYTIGDLRNPGRSINVSFSGALRPEQIPAAEALLAQDTGVLSATTAFGKTVVGAYLIARCKTNALILVHSSALLAQWQTALKQFLVIQEELPATPPKRGGKKKRALIGQLGSGKNTLGGLVDIAIMQSLFQGKEREIKELVADYGLVICDECHHVAAFTFEKILRTVTAEYVYGLSATPTRQDGHQSIIFMQCGPIRYLIDAKTQAERCSFAHYVLSRFTRTRLPEADGIQTVYSQISQNETRNALILRDTLAVMKKNRTPILLTERKEHAALLADALRDQIEHVILLTGSDSQREKREKLAGLKAVPAHEPLAVVATGKYVGEGFDEPRLDTLLLAMPIAWKGTLAQYVGRLHRNYEGKREVRVYDYVDIHVTVLERMYQKRLKGYAELGYLIKSSEQDESPGLIFDSRSFAQPFAADLAAAGRSILLVSPFIRKARVTSVLRKLSPSLDAGVRITVITRPPEDYNPPQQPGIAVLIDDMCSSGITVIPKHGIHQKYAVIDESIVWYGSINFLAYGASEESIMRFESPDIAAQLLDDAD